jgi:hypothetical protein
MTNFKCPCGKHSLADYQRMTECIASTALSGNPTNRTACGMLDLVNEPPKDNPDRMVAYQDSDKALAMQGESNVKEVDVAGRPTERVGDSNKEIKGEEDWEKRILSSRGYDMPLGGSFIVFSELNEIWDSQDLVDYIKKIIAAERQKDKEDTLNFCLDYIENKFALNDWSGECEVEAEIKRMAGEIKQEFSKNK